MWDRLGVTALFGVAANMDNISVGLAYGLKRRRIGWGSNLVIAAVTTLITLAALASGRAIREVLPTQLPDIVGGSMLLLMAAAGFYAERRGDGAFASRAFLRFAARPRVGCAETLVLAASLSINNIGLAIAGGIGGIDYRAAAVSIAVFSIALLALGQAAGTSVLQISLPPLARTCLNGNTVLVLVGVLMLAGH
jgi:putative Mn2+ efflux pump MntP